MKTYKIFFYCNATDTRKAFTTRTNAPENSNAFIADIERAMTVHQSSPADPIISIQEVR